MNRFKLRKVSLRGTIFAMVTTVTILVISAVLFAGDETPDDGVSRLWDGDGEEMAPAMAPSMEATGAMVGPGRPPVAPPSAQSGRYQKPTDTALRSMLTSLQYHVTQKDGTEYRFRNEYWDLYEDGIYVDVVSGEPLFSSLDKYKSDTGWPSFTRPLEPGNIVELADESHGMVRTEIRSLFADSHLGHLFEDGPAPTGLRYCMNSAAMRFIPVAMLEQEGYGQYLPLFGK